MYQATARPVLTTIAVSGRGSRPADGVGAIVQFALASPRAGTCGRATDTSGTIAARDAERLLT